MLLVGADSIMGVTLYREVSPEGFGAFDRGLSRSARHSACLRLRDDRGRDRGERKGRRERASDSEKERERDRDRDRERERETERQRDRERDRERKRFRAQRQRVRERDIERGGEGAECAVRGQHVPAHGGGDMARGPGSPRPGHGPAQLRHRPLHQQAGPAQRGSGSGWAETRRCIRPGSRPAAAGRARERDGNTQERLAYAGETGMHRRDSRPGHRAVHRRARQGGWGAALMSAGGLAASARDGLG